MKIRSKLKEKGSWLLTLEGKLTIDTMGIFEKAVDPLLLKKNNSIVLDCSGLNFIDSSGVGILMNAANRAKTAGIELQLSGVPDTVLTIFRAAKIESFFTIIEGDD